jgi:4-diphosphocytidyl-2C-methyl-D-erythritol kinase
MGQVLYYLPCSSSSSKLKEFLDLEQGNHIVFDYTQKFNTLAQYGSYHVDTDEKKANLFRKGLTIQLQDRLVHSPNLSYNDLTSAAIDQERTMKAIAEVEEKKRKWIMLGCSGSGGSSSAPPKYRMVGTPPIGQLHHPPR